MADLPYRVEKPWGYELVWARTDRYVGKVLHVRAGQALSRQYHRSKDETLHLLAGELVMTIEPPAGTPVRRVVKAGESIHLPALTIHEMEAVVDSDVLEASTAELDDIVRLNDRYGRA